METQPILASRLPHKLSLVVPMYNEADNVEPLLLQIHRAFIHYAYPWEIIIVNDGSSDQTSAYLHRTAKTLGAHVRILDMQRNFGQTAAMQAGIDAARGDVIATLDGDLQNDPNDIPRLIQRLLDEDLDLICGWRKDRKDNRWLRTIPSHLANWLIAKVTGVYLHDYGCSLKVYRASVIKNLRLYGEMHRFIPAWMATQTTPTRIKEEVVTHHSREHGASKYGISRAFRVLLDLLSVYFFMRFRARPGHFFGKIAWIFGAVGIVSLTYLFYVKFLLGENIGTRPLLFIALLCIIMSVQFLTTGVLSELVARTYFESSHQRSYVLRHPNTMNLHEDEGWNPE